jgi:prepilin-type N-terminal cleavage/methylation domain-containing protein
VASQRGFTLTEIAVVLAIVGILGALAVGGDPEDQANAQGQADRISAELESVRLRAMATRRWHRITVGATGATIEQSTTSGMATPTAYQVIRTFTMPYRIKVWSLSGSTLITDGSSPVDGTGLPGTISFGPDGSATANTIFLGDRRGRSRYRLAVFAATGFTRRYDRW